MIVLAWPALFVLNLLCKRKLKHEGWTDEDMSELQRRMLGDYPQHEVNEIEIMEAAE